MQQLLLGVPGAERETFSRKCHRATHYKQEAMKDPDNKDTAPAQCLNSAQLYFFLVTKYPLNDIGFELALPTFITLSRETFNFPF